MRRIVSVAIILSLAVNSGLAAAERKGPAPVPKTPATCAPAFAFSTQPAAMKLIEEKGGIAVILKGDGWYVGNPAFAKSAVPFVAGSPGMSGYLCPMAATSHDKGDRKAEIVDRYGNVLVTLDGKNADRELPALVAKPQDLLNKLQAEMRTRLAQGKTQAAKNATRAKELLAPLAALKGWAEAEEARRLVAGL